MWSVIFWKSSIIQLLHKHFTIVEIHVNYIFKAWVFSYVWRVFFQQIVGIPMATKCAHHLACLLFCSYEADDMKGNLKKNTKESRWCPFTLRVNISADMIFQNLYFLTRFPWWRVAAYKEVTEPGTLGVKVEVINTKMLLPQSWIG
jgi:hypothetical protein